MNLFFIIVILRKEQGIKPYVHVKISKEENTQRRQGYYVAKNPLGNS
jgi:hypothetical protein